MRIVLRTKIINVQNQLRIVNRKSPVISVLLPDVEKEIDLPLFLQEFSWVHFTKIDDSEALDNLEWGITSRHPKRGRSA